MSDYDDDHDDNNNDADFCLNARRAALTYRIRDDEADIRKRKFDIVKLEACIAKRTAQRAQIETALKALGILIVDLTEQE